MARFDTAGILDPSFGTAGIVNMNLNNVDDEFFDLRITADGNILATGFTTTQADLNFHLLVARFDPSGNLVPGFGNNGTVVWGETSYNVGYAMEILPDNKIIIAGSSGEKAPANSDWGIWKLTPGGTLDQTFGNGGVVTTDGGGQFDEALGVTWQEDGRLVAAGKFRINDNIDFGVARYLNNLSVSVPEQRGQEMVQVTPNPAGRGVMVNVNLHLAEKQTITIDILNINGESVFTRVLGMQGEGTADVQVTLPAEVAPGIYLLCVTGSGGMSGFSRLVVLE